MSTVSCFCRRSLGQTSGLFWIGLAIQRDRRSNVSGRREDDGCHAPITSLVLLECPMEIPHERIDDARTAVALVLTGDSIVLDLTPDERAAT
jgi:hypothetical protein